MGKSIDVSLACCAAILLLWIPTMLETFLTTQALGDSRSSTLPSSVSALWREGWVALSLVVASFLVVIPLVRIGALTCVLAALRFAGRRQWLGRVFRYGNALEPWAMLDIFLLALGIAYARLRAAIPVTVEPGAVLFVIISVLILMLRGTLDKQLVWHLILPDAPAASRKSSAVCVPCGMILPFESLPRQCPRCAAVVDTLHADGLFEPLALLVAAILLYVPANAYPIATLPVNLTPTSYTVLGGALELADSHLFGLALLVFTASFLIPLLKFIGLSWCIESTRQRSRRNLIFRTRVYRWLEEAGRWSMIDPLVIACFVPVLDYSGPLHASAEAAAFPFAAVVILTTLAVKLFDPRQMWRAAGFLS